jgi:hypothetical protein
MKKIFIIIFVILALNSCSSTSVEYRSNYLNNINNNEFKNFVYQNYIDIYSLQRITNQNEVIVYIEGDGLSWIDRFTPSSDPTPVDPLTFKLAKLDQSPNVIYLARPCQYIISNECRKEIWTKLQYSKDILGLYEQILEEIAQKHSEVHLIGYSGGSVIAMHLASLDNEKVKSVRTIAGNINPNEFTKLLNLSSYQTSINLDLMDDKIKDISQTHYYGNNDEVISKEIYLNYQDQYPNNSCVKITKVNASHNKGWQKFWIDNFSNYLNC